MSWDRDRRGERRNRFCFFLFSLSLSLSFLPSSRGLITLRAFLPAVVPFPVPVPLPLWPFEPLGLLLLPFFLSFYSYPLTLSDVVLSPSLQATLSNGRDSLPTFVFFHPPTPLRIITQAGFWHPFPHRLMRTSFLRAFASAMHFRPSFYTLFFAKVLNPDIIFSFLVQGPLYE